jgi:hypothetical protein
MAKKYKITRHETKRSKRKPNPPSAAPGLAVFIVIAGMMVWGLCKWDNTPTSYSLEQVRAVSELVPLEHPHKLTKRQRQAAALKDVWQLSDADIARPVKLW